MATNPQTVRAAKSMDAVLDAMRDFAAESDSWTLSECLLALTAEGTEGFGEVMDRATKAGVAGKLSVNTLRLYRDTAKRWPKDKRVSGVSFSAHREAMVLPNINEAARMLNDLAKSNGGPAKVTVGSVRKAVAVKQGKQPKAAPGHRPGATSPVKYADILRDLQDAGGAAFIAAIPTNLASNDLDKLHAGLSKVVGHVERQRAKVARAAKQASDKRAAAKQTPKPKQAAPKPKNGNGGNGGKRPVTSKSAPAKKAAGDLRGL